MPRIAWRGRSARREGVTADSPRPAGRRRWSGRLRRSGGFARRVLRVRRRRGDEVLATQPYGPHPAYPHAPHPSAVLTPASPPRKPAPQPSRIERPDGQQPLLPGERTRARQVRFLVVNGCTVASLGLGLLAILLAMRGEPQLAAVCLVGCVACDGLDGALARRLGVASPFGAQLDSLADMCAFGIAAPVVVYASVAGTVPAAGAAIACALAAACAAIRLARFNVSPKDGRFFTGVPTTMAAGVLAVAVLIDLPMPPTAMLLGVAALAFAMVSSFPYATLARLLRLPPWMWLAPLAGALVDARLTFVALVVAYLVSGPVLWVHRRRRVDGAPA